MRGVIIIWSVVECCPSGDGITKTEHRKFPANTTIGEVEEALRTLRGYEGSYRFVGDFRILIGEAADE